MDEGISLNVVNGRNEGFTSTGKHSWVVEINDKLNKMDKNRAIYRRPLNIRKEQDSNFLYTPRIVSFGPYHHESEYCQQTNKIKELVFLHCVESYGKRRDDYVDALREDVKNLKRAYNKLEPKWEQDEDAFLQLMVFDGCFLLHILHEGNHLGDFSHELLAMYEISPNELIEYYKHEMLLLENQLPMQLLEKLFAVQNDLLILEAQEDLYKLILRFVAPLSCKVAERLPRQKGEHVYIHVLDLFRHSLLLYHYERGGKIAAPTVEEAKMDSSASLLKKVVSIFIIMLLSLIFLLIGLPAMFPITITISIAFWSVLSIRYCLYWISKLIVPVGDRYFMIPSATELNKVGIRLFKKTKGLGHISYNPESRLWLPQIYVDGTTKSKLLNIIAFEQLHTDAENVLTSYIYFMSRLLQAPGDVGLLQLHDIIHTKLHKDEVVELFKRLTKDINVHDPNSLLDKNCQDIGERLGRTFHLRMINFWEKGFWQTFDVENPWVLISMTAAIFLFGLSAIQTIYTVMSYYKSK